MIASFRGAKDNGLVGSTAGLSFVENRPSLSSTEGALDVANGSRQHNAKSPYDLWSRAGLDFSGTSWHFPATFERGFASCRANAGDRWSVRPGDRRAWFSPDQAPIPRTELASADGSSNLCRGPVMRVDGVMDVSAVATRGARMMPGAFEDVEDGTLRARAIFDIFGRGLPSSGVERGEQADDVCPVEVPVARSRDSRAAGWVSADVFQASDLGKPAAAGPFNTRYGRRPISAARRGRCWLFPAARPRWQAVRAPAGTRASTAPAPARSGRAGSR